MANLQRFKLDLKAMAEKLDQDVSTVKRKVALDLYSKITSRTPVDTGRLRNSWLLGEGSRPSGVGEQSGGPQAPTEDIGRSKSTTWIVNNLPYVNRIEFGGHSQQAPNGMARISLAEVEAEFQRILEK